MATAMGIRMRPPKGITIMITMRRTYSRRPQVVAVLEIFEDGVPPRFRLRAETGLLTADACAVETVRPDGTRQHFTMVDRVDYLKSVEEIPEPHEFAAHVRTAGGRTTAFKEHEHAHASARRDNNMRAAAIHVIADATVSVFVIAGLLLARTFGWLWTDPLAGIIGAFVIASWSYALIRDTGAILLDMNPDRRMADNLRQTIEGGRRPACRPSSVATGAWASWGDCVHWHARNPRTRLLPGQARKVPVPLPPDDRS